jgi:hypothetical protein
MVFPFTIILPIPKVALPEEQRETHPLENLNQPMYVCADMSFATIINNELTISESRTNIRMIRYKCAGYIQTDSLTI